MNFRQYNTNYQYHYNVLIESFCLNGCTLGSVRKFWVLKIFWAWSISHLKVKGLKFRILSYIHRLYVKFCLTLGLVELRWYALKMIPNNKQKKMLNFGTELEKQFSQVTTKSPSIADTTYSRNGQNTVTSIVKVSSD